MRAHGDDICTVPEVGDDCDDDEAEDREEIDGELAIEVGVTATSSSSIPASKETALKIQSSVLKDADWGVTVGFPSHQYHISILANFNYSTVVPKN